MSTQERVGPSAKSGGMRSPTEQSSSPRRRRPSMSKRHRDLASGCMATATTATVTLITMLMVSLRASPTLNPMRSMEAIRTRNPMRDTAQTTATGRSNTE
ncbi:hypothetical protein MUK42_11660 [Musa troglodytarum]|uniref:Uncharacterized protein n=1 Tax=Musa troglodytarum TaxID=320322 RepID=A0A9E7GMM5_9LILI|nr:hypothetical protein MUK42_11660 [Musa troglodytarum]